MSLTADAVPDAPNVEEEDRHDHPTDLQYVKIALLLGVITALEVGTYFIEEASTTLLMILLMSSLTMVLAVTAARRRDDRNTKVWLCVTALLGACFVAGQVYEFTTFYREGLGFTTSLFSSSFYTLTGFHGVHVSVGIVILLSVVGMIARGRTPSDKSELVEIVGLYWHFVDIVWILIFTLVYLIPA